MNDHPYRPIRSIHGCNAVKVIFLDFDGVLNAQTDVCCHGVSILPQKIQLLKQIVDATGAKIVLSTSWREHWSADETGCDDTGVLMNGIFSQSGLEIWDKTPQLPPRREAQIRSWLDAHPETENFVVLDDALLSADFMEGHL